MMARMDVMNPVAETVQYEVSPAPRPSSLIGKTVGLVWNLKSGGDVALTHIASLLGRRFEGIRFHRFDGAFGGYRVALVDQLKTGEADEIARECDVVVGTTAD
jgi:hypothetical protein